MRRSRVLLALCCAVSLGACGSIDSGQVGIWSRFGDLDDETVGPGLHWYNPITTDLIAMNVQSQTHDERTEAFTMDAQVVNVSYRLTFRLDASRAVAVRRSLGDNYAATLLPSMLQSVTKNVIGRYTAMATISQRPRLQQQIEAFVRQGLAARGIVVESYQITNLDFSDEFEQAVERAQTATQRAVEAQNATVRIREEAAQRVIQAESEARAIQLQAAAISANPAIVEMRRVERWNGQLCPEGSTTCIIGAGQTPLLNVGTGR